MQQTYKAQTRLRLLLLRLRLLPLLVVLYYWYLHAAVQNTKSRSLARSSCKLGEPQSRCSNAWNPRRGSDVTIDDCTQQARPTIVRTPCHVHWRIRDPQETLNESMGRDVSSSLGEESPFHSKKVWGRARAPSASITPLPYGYTSGNTAVVILMQ